MELRMVDHQLERSTCSASAHFSWDAGAHSNAEVLTRVRASSFARGNGEGGGLRRQLGDRLRRSRETARWAL